MREAIIVVLPKPFKDSLLPELYRPKSLLTSDVKITLYADDALLFLGDTKHTLSSLMRLIAHFGEFSGFRINWDTSVLLPLDPLTGTVPVVEASQMST